MSFIATEITRDLGRSFSFDTVVEVDGKLYGIDYVADSHVPDFEPIKLEPRMPIEDPTFMYNTLLRKNRPEFTKPRKNEASKKKAQKLARRNNRRKK